MRKGRRLKNPSGTPWYPIGSTFSLEQDEAIIPQKAISAKILHNLIIVQYVLGFIVDKKAIHKMDGFFIIAIRSKN